MSFPLESLNWIAGLGVAYAVWRLFWALKKSENIKPFLVSLFLPDLRDSSVIVFHYTCVVGVFFVVIAIWFNRVEWTGATLQPKPTQGLVSIKRTGIQTKESTLIENGHFRFSPVDDQEFSITGRSSISAVIALILGLITASSFTTLMGELHAKGLTTASSVQSQILAKTHEIQRNLRSQNIPIPNAEHTLLRAIHHLDALDPAKTVADGTVSFSPEVHLIIAVDSELPNPYPTPVTTILFSHLQTMWSRHYNQPEQYAVVSISDKQHEVEPKEIVQAQYFQTANEDDTGQELDRLLAAGVKCCLKQLVQNHEQFGLNKETNLILPFPRSIRLLFGSAESLVQTAADFDKYPNSAFPLLTQREKVLNLWMDWSIGRVLFNVAQKGGDNEGFFYKFDSGVEQLVKKYLGVHGFSDCNNTDVFRHARAFGIPETEWHDLDCFVIGTRLLQEGYVLKVVEDRTQALIATVGLLPIVLAALHFKQVLSFPDIVRYINTHVKRSRTDAERGTTKVQLTMQLNEFQKNKGGFKHLKDFT